MKTLLKTLVLALFVLTTSYVYGQEQNNDPYAQAVMNDTGVINAFAEKGIGMSVVKIAEGSECVYDLCGTNAYEQEYCMQAKLNMEGEAMVVAVTKVLTEKDPFVFKQETQTKDAVVILASTVIKQEFKEHDIKMTSTNTGIEAIAEKSTNTKRAYKIFNLVDKTKSMEVTVTDQASAIIVKAIPDPVKETPVVIEKTQEQKDSETIAKDKAVKKEFKDNGVDMSKEYIAITLISDRNYKLCTIDEQYCMEVSVATENSLAGPLEKVSITKHINPAPSPAPVETQEDKDKKAILDDYNVQEVLVYNSIYESDVDITKKDGTNREYVVKTKDGSASMEVKVEDKKTLDGTKSFVTITKNIVVIKSAEDKEQEAINAAYEDQKVIDAFKKEGIKMNKVVYESIPGQPANTYKYVLSDKAETASMEVSVVVSENDDPAVVTISKPLEVKPVIKTQEQKDEEAKEAILDDEKVIAAFKAQNIKMRDVTAELKAGKTDEYNVCHKDKKSCMEVKVNSEGTTPVVTITKALPEPVVVPCAVKVIEIASASKGSRIVVPEINGVLYLTEMLLGTGWYTTDMLQIPAVGSNAVIKRTKNSKKQDLEEAKQKTWNVVFDNITNPTKYTLDLTDAGKTTNALVTIPAAPVEGCVAKLVEISSEKGGSTIVVPEINGKLDMTQIKLGAGWYSTDIMTLSVDKKVSITITRKYNSKKQALSADQQKTWTLSFDDKDAPSYYKVK